MQERIRESSRELHAKLARCRATDAIISFAWLILIVMPPLSYSIRMKTAKSFGDSPASSMMLLLLTSSLSLSLSIMRLTLSFQVPKNVRVDKMSNAPRVGRQIAYVCDCRTLAWWFWAGYIAAPVLCALNIFLSLVWFFILDLSFTLLFLVTALSIISATSIVRCTKWFYEKGVQSNYNFNIARSSEWREEWARFRAVEMRNFLLEKQEV